MGVLDRMMGKSEGDSTEDFLRRFARRSRGWTGELAKGNVELYDRVAELERRVDELTLRKPE
jgi:hypothetical protein